MAKLKAPKKEKVKFPKFAIYTLDFDGTVHTRLIVIPAAKADLAMGAFSRRLYGESAQVCNVASPDENVYSFSVSIIYGAYRTLTGPRFAAVQIND